MNIIDYLSVKDLYLALNGKENQPDGMYDSDWETLDRKALGTIRLSLGSAVAFNVANEKSTKGAMDALSKLYEKP